MPATGECSPVRPGSVDEVEEWQIRNSETNTLVSRCFRPLPHINNSHRDDSQWRHQGPTQYRLHHALPMEIPPLRSQDAQDLESPLRGHQASRVSDLDSSRLISAIETLELFPSPRRQRRHALETPFLVWDALERVVTVLDDFLLPA